MERWARGGPCPGGRTEEPDRKRAGQEHGPGGLENKFLSWGRGMSKIVTEFMLGSVCGVVVLYSVLTGLGTEEVKC